VLNQFKDYNEETKETTYKTEENVKPKDITKYESRIFMYSSPSRNYLNDSFTSALNYMVSLPQLQLLVIKLILPHLNI